ncbi:hypothetical protein DAPPUDRAFT_61523 [Daphnia pulex]|uniref:Sugar phosphate transporter domain-containing protein n=1 Tax=Daphnia pulex TaxID=6669 RepID=E9HDF5_DAPPU|nr:hypothetical protein DAPPUDRAFT_61523 [Daphnia pulex]|eukprot:EFX70257.1 hypothetical protein DAPPUDRAFT_61523 [Daphnia pulex]
MNTQQPTRYLRISSALFYAAASFLITVVNKIVLTSYKFPSFQVLGLGQMVSTVVVLSMSKKFGYVSFPSLQKDTFRRIWPLPLIFAGNMMTGLGGTQQLSLPMLTVLRRFSILMTMVAEYYILGLTASCSVQFSVYMMIFGALVAASEDLAFNLQGYTYISLNNVLTASNGVFLKKKLDAKDLGKNGLLFYNSLFMIPLALIIAGVSGDLHKAWEYQQWGDIGFLSQFMGSCFMGFVLSYSTLLCTQYNSPLTTTIVGCLKNIAVTYLGIFIGGDYIFSVTNFIGLNISVAGSLVYTWVTFREKETRKSGNDVDEKPLLTKEKESPA